MLEHFVLPSSTGIPFAMIMAPVKPGVDAETESRGQGPPGRSGAGIGTKRVD
jgi:hypothetical protein